MRLVAELAEGNRGPITGALPNRPQSGSRGLWPSRQWSAVANKRNSGFERTSSANLSLKEASMSSPDPWTSPVGLARPLSSRQDRAPGLRAEAPSSEKVDLGIECESAAFPSTA